MLSARNQFKGTVKSVTSGNVMAEVVVSAGGSRLWRRSLAGRSTNWGSRSATR